MPDLHLDYYSYSLAKPKAFPEKFNLANLLSWYP
jgi:hypothetical protein